MHHLLLTLLSLCIGLPAVAADFSWPSATVYFLITDRFLDGDSTNNVNYGRIVDYGSDRLNAATFHGGDLRGVLQKAREGYFRDLGVDVVWITDVYEQIHGWTAGSGAINDFPHYGYHGYYPLDYTQMDRNYGTIEDMRQLVDELHSQGIRVMLGANFNDPGYPTFLDAVQLGYAQTGMTEEEAAQHTPGNGYDQWAHWWKWSSWWGRDWLRCPDEGWDESDKLTCTLYGLPDFKDEKTEPVRLPQFLKDKWDREGNANDPWVNPSGLPLRQEQKGWAPADYVIAWIASWVEEFGIDGFRCDIVEYVHLNRWRQLSEACNAALSRWRERHPANPASQWTEPFFLTGDFDNATIDYKPDYADAGFSSMVNFYFPKHGDLDGIVPVWQAYADSVEAHPNWHPFSYLNNSYHREADPLNMIDCATTLLLAPGVAQIFYGDETGRHPNAGAMLNGDSDQSFRSDMNWTSIDSDVLRHFQRLGQIRRNHPVIATGRQISIDNHTCARYNDTDTILIRVKPNTENGILVDRLWPDGTTVEDLYTGTTTSVSKGKASFPVYANKVAVLRRIQE
ncbi:MAG: hypothetical protein LUC85_07225 [Bacteroidales bacterium]|nr:hypothetical protein [Bacteroidales bacterium]